ncbi:uncharacterized protein LOC121876546 isoform X1 [Homarus americanus]|uniref:Uncharacterized protein n=1 Tax=Homarus americanus TaxID=6706 RepID=A0A8J5NBH9_HOMAM|nr:uncharacterized protein LOC121876546 isoform X1 [Homarus americanus]XP_042237689.1 uncharacterized protein LOC121876546 isoform X1 [Homarus americanus]XP_042237697.1 uncharacterized protein LOC121876546 isoform X1 [Homarus americanus]XP_042237704.1 uncharacterized protein LOC121876546 isoform X1 [Homarus americanus]XP_042237711.1 uncharacterized protein LOC121876546 isoform X1 [Homarus americanus]KAG7176248.1 hypothetical protein Hamer_G009026 [Homarus americanus]
MLTNSLVKMVVVSVVLLAFAAPSHSFFLNHLYDSISNSFYDHFVEPIVEVTIGGGTGIVYNALTHNFLGLQPHIRRVWRTVVVDGGGFVISGIASGIWDIAVGIVRGIGRIVKTFAQNLWNMQYNLIYYGFRLLNPFSFVPDVNVLVLSDVDVAKNIKVANGSNAKSNREGVTVLRGRRAVGIEYQNLRYDFLSATLHDPMQCLPLVLCAIHADPDDLITAKEAAFRKTFRPYFTQQPIPDWAEQYVHAADIGATTKSTDSCREAYPFCGFSQYYLRKLITQAMNSEGRSLLQTYK